jgi:acyl transferase domain-containing protein
MEAVSEPIAIVGLSCRLPQAPDVAAYWRLLADGVDAIGEAPEDRWVGTSTHRLGGFLDAIGDFDADFFGISPREAAAMDPRQRLVLELSWEALEDAGIVPNALRDRAVGVFVGAMGDDYAVLADRLATIGRHTMTGVHRGIIANRVSHVLGLRGPSITVDTAQSSSLVAVHLACESLRRGESDVAIVGGVNLNILAEANENVARFGALSPDGRCYTFDARANGFVRGEGGGVAVLKPLSQALADGDLVYCVVAGGAVNHDGTSSALAVPNAVAQQQVISAAFADAGIDRALVQYVELHGTGTPVGDPVEAAALDAALGRPVLVGSVKTNIGHLEAAAGIAGLLKVALSIRHRALPPSLNFDTPHPSIPANLTVHTALTPWPRADEPLVAGVSSFGMGGTNCHLVLREASHPIADPVPEPVALAWPISGRTPEAVRALAARLVSVEGDAVDIGFSLATTRTRFRHRVVVVGRDRAELTASLAALADGTDAVGVVRGIAGPLGRTVFVFPGQGSQWAGMAGEMLDTVPVFAASIRACADALAPHVDWSLEDVLRSGTALDRVDVVQPVLFAVMVSLARTWQSCGVEPAAAVGHSQGEIAAAHVAGALSLSDAARVVSLRSRALLAVAGRSGMVSVRLPLDDVRERIGAWDGRVSVSAVNGPSSVAVSGDLASLDELMTRFAADGVTVRRVAIDYGSHSRHVEEIHGPLLAALDGIEPVASAIPFYSTVTGDVLDGAELGPEYWYRNERSPIQLEHTIRALVRDGHTTFVECSPHPLLLSAIGDTAGESVTVGSLRRDDGGLPRFLLSLGELHARGGDVDWTAVYPGARRITLPTYAFQRSRYWLGETATRVQEPTRDPRELVSTNVAIVLGHVTPDAVDPDRTFQELGFDSQAALELRNRLSAATGIRLPAGLQAVA